ncbi:polyketide synthase pks18 [Amphichorda felina]
MKSIETANMHVFVKKLVSTLGYGATTNIRDTLKHGSLKTRANTNDNATLTVPPATIVIEGIATGVPESMKKQNDTAEVVISLLNSPPEQQERIRRLYAKTRIDKRHMAVDPLSPAFDRRMAIRKRMDLFLEHAVPLAVEVSLRALASARVGNHAEDIGLLVLVTSTGFVAPGVDVAVAQGLGLSPSVARVVVNFMGCAAAMNGLRAAADYVRSHPGSKKKALVCCVELSSVNAVFADNINDFIISSLFADGCAAMVVGPLGEELKPGQVIIRDHFNCLVDGTHDGITLGINDTGITCELSPKLPSYIYGGLAPVIDKALDSNEMAKSDVQLWAIHPGGPKIIEESVRGLGLDSAVAATSWDVLSEFGNMLSASLPFVLERMVGKARLGRKNSTGLAFSFAPGVTVEGLLFEVVCSG